MTTRRDKQQSPAEREQRRAERDRYVARWRAAKLFADSHTEDIMAQIAAAQVAYGSPISLYSFAFVLQQMQEQGLAGVPYVDVRTFNEWRKAGRIVRKGERWARYGLASIKWVDGSERRKDAEGATSAGKSEGGDEPDAGRKWPKMTKLFHISQTEELAATEVKAA